MFSMTLLRKIISHQLCRAFALALLTAAARAGEFEFVVIGDTRPHFESVNFQTFARIIPQINAVKPALVINLGDLIYGYGRNKEKQWDKYQQVIQAFRVPYYQVPGNHDTFSRDARRVYGQRFGKFYQSFDHAGWHFLLLDNTENESWGYIGAAQLAWMRDDLKRNQGKPTFVFLHVPVWLKDRVAPKYYEFWESTLHPLFLESGVKGVFGGHLHAYGPTEEIDGIRYFITGGGGAELRPSYQEVGGRHHFVRVKVLRDNTFGVRVVTATSEMTDAEADVMGGFLFADKNCAKMGLVNAPQQLWNGVHCTFTLLNPYPQRMTGVCEWKNPAAAFTCFPARAEINLLPGTKTNLTFRLKADPKAPMPAALPSLAFDLKADNHHHRFERGIEFLDSLTALYRKKSPLLDGRLEDWLSQAPLRLGLPTNPDAEIWAGRDSSTLYLALSIPTPKAQPAVAVEEPEEDYRDDLQIGLAMRPNPTSFDQDLVRLGFTCSTNKTEIFDRTPGRKRSLSLRGVKVACHTGNVRRVFEVAIPLRLLQPVSTRKEARVALTLAYPLSDDGPGEPDQPQPNTFAYQVRYGMLRLLPCRYFELVLVPKR